MKNFDIDKWNRKDQYDFFKNYEDPFFNLTANLEVTILYDYCKKNAFSFSLTCLFFALKGMNEITEFKLRIVDNKVVIFDKIHLGSTILNSDNTFSFCYFNYKNDLLKFIEEACVVLEQNRNKTQFEPKENVIDLAHCSTLPWLSFTGFKHAKKGDERHTGIPKLVFGKMFELNNKRMLPFSVEVHHALMDGLHVANLFEIIQDSIDHLA